MSAVIRIPFATRQPGFGDPVFIGRMWIPTEGGVIVRDSQTGTHFIPFEEDDDQHDA